MKFVHLLFGFFALLVFSQCSLGRKIVYYNTPDHNDHSKFPCDTILSKVDTCIRPFCKTKNQQLPDPKLWAIGTPPKDGVSPEEFLTETNSHCLIVIRNDSLIYENYFNGYQPQQERIVFSLAKVFITSLADIAIQEKHINSVHQKVKDFLPGFDKDGKENITINHLLNMTSGLNQDDYGKLFTTAKTYYHSDLDVVISKTKMDFAPGSKFIYKSIDTQILGRCIEEATDMKIQDYLQSRIWDKIGLCHDAQITLDHKNGSARMFGGTAMVPMDLVHFGYLFLNKGKQKGQQIIRKSWVNEIENRNFFDQWIGYSNGWWRDVMVNKSIPQDKDYFAAGFNGQNLYIDPENNTVILRLGKNKGGNVWHISMGLLSKAINGKPVQHLIKTIDLDATYFSIDKKTIEIENKDGYWLMDLDGEKTKLHAYGPRSISHIRKKIRLTFDFDEGHKIKGLFYDNTLEPIKYFSIKDNF